MSEEQSGAGATAERVASFLGNAAARAKRQAELVTINTVTLPKLYHTVGKHLMSMEKLPPDLEQRRQSIRQLEARNAESVKPAEPPAESSQQGGLAAKAAQMAKSAARTAAKAGGDAARTAQIQAEYVAMGKTAVEKYGDKVVPQGERDRFNALVARREQLLAQQASGAGGRPSAALRYVGFLVFLGGIFCAGALWRSMWSTRAPVAVSRNESVKAEKPVRQAAKERTAPDANDRPQAGSGQRRSNPSGEFPLTLERLAKMIGPEGPGITYVRGDDGNVQRIEWRRKGSLMMCASPAGDGFRITLGGELALAALATSPVFTRDERDALVDAYSQFVVARDEPFLPIEAGRIRVNCERDPHYRTFDSLIISPLK